ncbi:hypothetical protein GCM10022228_03040 [Halomonas cibimaris]|uniref:Transcriptional regulator n=1 Tax=Halomonas cibimaris TaxID=657012 RepID=A0ABP7L5K9_9GAMM
MKHRNAATPQSGRDKLRQFKELDDAFAKALKALDDPDTAADIPTGPPVRSLDTLEREDDAKAREQAFGRHLEALMKEYGISHAALLELSHTLLDYGLWEDRPPAQR